MSVIQKAIALSLLFILSISCVVPDDNSVSKDVEIHDFIWKAMNLHYLWQKDVGNLSDTRFKNQSELNNFMSSYTPTSLFQSLLYQPQTIDRYSLIFEDYTVLEEWLTGTESNNGMTYGLTYKDQTKTSLYGWVRYVAPNSNAASKNVERGMLFYAVNNTPLSLSNYSQLLGQNSYTIQLADYNGGAITPNGKEISLTKTSTSENPVFMNKVIDAGDKKIGYLMYNAFYNSHDITLNNAFASFKSNNITDLVLDLRYNGGGSIQSAKRLASMITGQFTNKVFSKQRWNAKVQDHIIKTDGAAALEELFVDTIDGTPINSLNLNKVYILTGPGTASSSELVINCLKPYITVVQIGTKTVGKNVGSITLYDAIDFSKEKRSDKHKYAIQPIVVQTENADGFGQYELGISPDIEYKEDYGNLGAIGDEEEPLLKLAINQIKGIATRIESRSNSQEELITNDGIMYIDNPPTSIFSMKNLVD